MAARVEHLQTYGAAFLNPSPNDFRKIWVALSDMASSEPKRILDPSDYIAHHLHNFSTPQPTSGVDIHVWNRYLLVRLVLVAVATACLVARSDRTTLFLMAPPMRFGRRLTIWWSCIWRQTLATLQIFVVGMAAFLFVAMKLPAMMSVSAAGRMLNVTIATFVVAGVFSGAVSLPLTGYMVREGSVAHELATFAPFTFRQATLLGLTTVVWIVIYSASRSLDL